MGILNDIHKKRIGKKKVYINEYVGNINLLKGMSVSKERADNWVEFSIDGFECTAKVFAEGSDFGIDGGRVSKLGISKNNKTICNYDRGWDIEPRTKAGKEVLRKIVEEIFS